MFYILLPVIEPKLPTVIIIISQNLGKFLGYNFHLIIRQNNLNYSFYQKNFNFSFVTAHTNLTAL